MRLSWSKEAKEDFISEALVSGHAERFLGSEREAKLFRFSLYRLLHTNGNNQPLIATISGRKITLIKPPIIYKRP